VHLLTQIFLAALGPPVARHHKLFGDGRETLMHFQRFAAASDAQHESFSRDNGLAREPEAQKKLPKW